jgi:hypothetical protein
MIRRLYISLFLIALVIISSCSSGRKAGGKERKNIPNRKTAELIDSIKQNDLSCEWLSIKYDVEVKSQKVDDSFKMYVRLRQDSVIWISATYYAVEIARFLFTPDSVLYIDRRNNKYYAGNYDYITDKFMIEADYNTLQSLILANGSAFIDQSDEKIRSSEEDNNYYISFIRKGQLKRAIKKEDSKKPLDLVVSLWVHPSSFRIKKATVVDYDEGRSLSAEYSDFQPQCNSYYPNEIVFLAESPNEQAKVKTSVIKVTSDKKVSVSFTIPEKYEPLVP